MIPHRMRTIIGHGLRNRMKRMKTIIMTNGATKMNGGIVETPDREI
jgi:hypothetical protein